MAEPRFMAGDAVRWKCKDGSPRQGTVKSVEFTPTQGWIYKLRLESGRRSGCFRLEEELEGANG